MRCLYRLILLISCLLCSFLNIQAQNSIQKLSIVELDSLIKNAKHPLVINFWATFCKPCIEEIPYFEKSIAALPSSGVQLILVSLDLPDYYPNKINAFVKLKQFSSKIYWLNESNADIFCPVIDRKWSGAIPATLMVHPQKKYQRFYEQQLSSAQLDKALSELLQ